MNKKLIAGFTCLALSFGLLAQDNPPENWFNLDLQDDKVPGVSTEKAYKELLQGKKSTPVVVAIIDSGVEVDHEDLKNVMWTNPGEIAGNGIDDDKNGYIDDIHGWNFIGGPNGNVNDDTYEVTRLYKKYKYKYEQADRKMLTKKQQVEYDLYVKYKAEVEKKLKSAQSNLDRIKQNEAGIMGALDKLDALSGGKKVTDALIDSLDAVQTTDQNELKDNKMMVNISRSLGSEAPTAALMKLAIKSQFQGAYDYYGGQLKHAFNIDFDPRDIVGDNYADPYEKYYGNNQVEGPDALHGTHVAGIVGAERNNNIGMNGVADNVQIMSIRTVPNGDERDKDVANSIIYAVDNGATVINMSFGKGYSWNEEVVEKAIKYAEKNDVLLVHAAGNSSQDNDITDNFPNSEYTSKCLFWKKQKAYKNWIEVGALNHVEGDDYVAPFSNYGQKNVDIFAPGMAIYSTIPDNGYRNLQGTSMASPVVAGAAALLRSYFPTLTAVQVKEILMESSTKPAIEVLKPGTDEKVPFKTLSVSGGQLNVYNAVKAAMTVKGKRKIKKS